MTLQPEPQPIVVGERAVVHQAKIEPGRERVRVLGRDRALGRHARVADRVRAAELGQAKASGDRLGPAFLLVDLDALADPHEAHLGPAPGQRAPDRLGRGVTHQHAVARPHLALDPGAKGRGQIRPQLRPGIALVLVMERELDRHAGGRRAIDGKARAVRPALAHPGQHRREIRPEPRLEAGALQNRPTIPHMAASARARGPAPRWWRPTEAETTVRRSGAQFAVASF